MDIILIQSYKIPIIELIGKWQADNPLEKLWINDTQEDHSFAFQKGTQMQQKIFSKNFGDVQLKESDIGQFKDGLGVFANKDFKAGEIVIKWKLKILTKHQYQDLPLYEKENFCHKRDGIQWLYPDPERHVNRSKNPNVVPNFEMQANIALRDIKKGEELSIAKEVEI